MSDNLHNYWVECYSIWQETEAFYNGLAKNIGLSNAAFLLMYSVCAAQGKYTQKEICNQWSMSKQTVHTALKELEKKGYVILIAKDRDRRNKNIELTDLGRKFAEENIKSIVQMEERSLQQMSVSEIEAMIHISRKYLELLRQEAHLTER